MDDTSVFQTLPPHVIGSVVRYVVEAPFLGNIYSGHIFNVKLSDLQPLLSLSQQWRGTALDIGFSRCQISPGRTPILTYRILEGTGVCLDRKQHRELVPHVKRIQLVIQLEDILDGERFARVEEQLGELPGLLGARFLDVRFESISVAETSAYGPGAVQRVARFLDILRASIPVIRHVVVDMAPAEPIELGPYGPAFNKLVQGVLLIRGQSKVAGLRIAGGMSSPSVLGLPPLTGLTSIRIQWDSGYRDMACLLHANQKSLTYLSICYCHFKGMQRLILDSTGSPVIYPNVSDLGLCSLGKSKVKAMLPFDEGIVPFPHLRQIEIPIPYPFSDDTPLRGNHRQIKSLMINANRKTLEMLKSKGVLAKGSMPCLWRLSIINSVDEGTPVPDTYTDLIKNNTDVIRWLCVVDMQISWTFVSSLADTNRYTRLEHLSVSNLHLTLADLVGLLGKLPRLNYLVSKVSRLGDEYQRLSILDVANMVRSRYHGLNQCLCRWFIVNSDFFPFSSIITCILILADVCEGLKDVLFVSKVKDSLKRQFKRVAGYRLYQAYEQKFTVDLKLSTLPVVNVKRKEPTV